MRRLRTLAMIAFMGVLLEVYLPQSAFAESLRYEDEAGNLHFVDRLSDIPDRYREQVVPSRPTASSDQDYKKQLSEWKRQQKDSEKETKRQLREREKLEKERKKKLEKEERKKAKEMQKKIKPTPTPRPERVTAKPTPQPSVSPAEAGSVGRVRTQ